MLTEAAGGQLSRSHRLLQASSNYVLTTQTFNTTLSITS